MKTVNTAGITICACGIREKCGKPMFLFLMRLLAKGNTLDREEQWQCRNGRSMETELEEYLDTEQGLSVALDVKSDFAKSEEAIEILRKRMVERNWGLQLYISYFDQDGNEIAYDRVGINTYSIERVKLDWDYKNAEMKERWEHAGDTAE